MLVRTGQTVDILCNATNPPMDGAFLIPEQVQSGKMFSSMRGLREVGLA